MSTPRVVSVEEAFEILHDYIINLHDYINSYCPSFNKSILDDEANSEIVYIAQESSFEDLIPDERVSE